MIGKNSIKTMNKDKPNTDNRKGLPQRRSIRLKGYDYSQAGLYFITICCENRKYRFGEIKNGEMILNEYGTVAFNEWAKLSERFQNFELDVFQIMPNHMHGIILLNELSVRAGFTPARIVENNPISPNNPPAQIIQNNPISPNNTPAQFIQNNPITPNNPPAQIIQNDPIAPNNTPAQNDGIAQNNLDFRATARVAPTISDIVGAYKSLVANGCLNIYKSKNETMGKLWQRNYYEHIIRNEKAYQNISDYIINNPAKWNEDNFFTK